MSNPSFSNIDMWLFELAEGNLSPDQIAKLELFLLQNPDLDVDRDVWEMAKVSAAPVVYPDQAGLRKRKPVGLYVMAGSSALLLLTLFGVLSLFTFNAPEMPVQMADSSSEELRQENSELRQEINDLKTIVTSLEDEISTSRGGGGSYSSESINLNVVEGSSSSSSSSLEASAEGIEGGSASAASSTSAAMVAATTTGGETGAARPTGLVSTPTLRSTTATPGMSVLIEPTSPMIMASAAEEVTEKVKKEIDYKEAETLITSADYDKTTTSRRTTSDWTNTYHVDYNFSMKNRFFKWGKQIQRMMDNPVALRNSRDPHFHVPGMSSQDLNFGATGTLIAPRVQTLSRLQWHGESNELFKNQLSVDGYSFGMRGGIGIQLNHSYYSDGGLQVADAAITYSPKFSISRTVSVEPAIRFKMGNKLLDDSKMDNATHVEIDRGIVHNYYNNGTQPVGQSLWYRDLGLGVNVNTEWFFASAQIDNIFKHQDNIYSSDLTSPRRAGTHFVTTVGTDWESRKKSRNGVPVMGMSPYLVYQKNEQLSEAWLGVNYRWRWLTVGGAVSSNFDPAASIGIKLKHFSLQYNADYAYSIMNNKNSLSHQVTLRFLGKPSNFGKRLLNL